MYNVDHPNFDLSYETITHKKIPSSYDICFAIPQAKKYIVWFYKSEGKNICQLFELNRYKKISVCSLITTSNIVSDIYSGTILFGSINCNTDDHSLFIVEDILMFKGASLRNVIFGVKLGLIEVFLENQGASTIHYNYNDIISKTKLTFFLPVFWKSHIGIEINSVPSKDLFYPLHHIQYRSLTSIVPYLNVFLNNRGTFPWDEITSKIDNKIVQNNRVELIRQINTKTIYPSNSHNHYNIGKCTFIVIADSQNDIYHLFASSLGNAAIYYDVAYIPNYKSSVYMNSLFRNIKENVNIDFIEESDDEEDFEDVRENKYVNLEKKIFMECVYHTKFRRWVPIKVICEDSDDMTIVVSIDNLPRLRSNT